MKNSRRGAACCALFLLTLSTSANAAPSRVWWPQWKVESSEELSQGRKYSSYPIPLMLDSDPKTAWVYSAKSKEFDKTVFNLSYGFVFTPSTPVTIDALRIMNGHNRSRSRFLRNHRITKVRIVEELTDQRKFVTRAQLSDTMGWHTIKLPRHKIKSLKIEFPTLKLSDSKDADLCISELELRDQGKKIDWRLPRAVMFYDGLEGCAGSSLITHNGEELDGIANAEGYSDKWSKDGRYVCGVGYVKRDKDWVPRLWIADVWRGKIVRRLGQYIQNLTDYHWMTEKTLVVEYKENNKLHSRNFKGPSFR